jgi:hypothetical protein
VVAVVPLEILTLCLLLPVAKAAQVFSFSVSQILLRQSSQVV